MAVGRSARGGGSAYRSAIVGVDIGTAGVRAVAFAADGTVIGQAVREYRLHTPRPRWAEQDPEEVLRATTGVVREVVDRVRAERVGVAGIGLSSVMHSLLATDANGHPLTRVLTWADARAYRQSAELKARLGNSLYRRTGCPMHPMYLPAKIRWIREEEPETFAQARWFCSIKEYVIWCWTGIRVVDRSIASASGLLNVRTGRWDDEALRATGIEAGVLSDVTEPTTAVSTIRPEFAEAMGVDPHTPVVLGAGDGVLANLGAGAVAPGQMTCTIGTSGAVRLVATEPALDPEGRTWTYYLARDAEGAHWVNGAAINNGGIVCRWVWEQLFGGSGADDFDFGALEQWASSSPPGSNGLLFLPFLAGERSPYWNADARGVLFGLALSHTRSDVARSVFEGIGHHMRSVFLALEEVGGRAREIRATGGFTRSAFWLQLQADMLGRPLVVPRHDEASAFGAAVLAMVALGWLPSLRSAGHLVELGDEVEPNAERHDRYAQMYDIFMRIYWNVQREFTDLCAWQQADPRG